MDTPDKNARSFPPFPRVGVGVLVLHQDKVLLVKRGQEPAKGEWSVPGGLVELGETVEETAHRELLEECNITVNLKKQLDVFEFIEKDDNDSTKYHFIVIEFLADYKGGALHAMSDIDDAKWVAYDDVAALHCNSSILKLVDSAFSR